MQVMYGVVENRNDPLQLGRCQVRVMSIHTADKTVLPTEDLPWAVVMQPATSAAMNGIGHAPVGLVPGTWVIVVFQDEDCQQPIILGSVGGIPDTNSITSNSEDDVIVVRDPVTGVAEEQIISTNVEGVPIKTIVDPVVEPPKPQKVTNGEVNLDLPRTSPPPYWKGDRGKAASGIQALIVACKQGGYTDKNAISAILGIAGGECDWIPKNEGFVYSQNRLMQVYKVFRDNPELAAKYANNPTELPEFIYGYTTTKGKDLGNLSAGDGAKYIGRGFIQITGLYNYARYKRLSGVDIVANPDTLNTNLENSAKVAVAYFKDKLSGSNIRQNDARFFEAAVRAVGNNTIDIHAKKLKYYEYFMGKELSFDSKNAEHVDIRQKENNTTNVAGSVTELPGGDRSQNTTIGFCDPEGKYPLRQYLHEPDTNRLARGIVSGTIVEKKDHQRLHCMPIAFGEQREQPEAPFAAKYPFNKVFESESGHIMEFDDTPKQERISICHRTGTFTEIDANGTQVNKIIGDGFIIIERNGCVYVHGECNLTANGNINILCKATANVEVMGSANVDIRQDAIIGVHRDVELGVGRDARILVGRDMQSRIERNVVLDIGGNMSTKVAGNYDVSCANFHLSTTGVSNIKSAGIASIDGSQVHLNSGLSTAAITPWAKTPTDTDTSNRTEFALHIPLEGVINDRALEYLQTMSRELSNPTGETHEDITADDIFTLAASIPGELPIPDAEAVVDGPNVPGSTTSLLEELKASGLPVPDIQGLPSLATLSGSFGSSLESISSAVSNTLSGLPSIGGMFTSLPTMNQVAGILSGSVAGGIASVLPDPSTLANQVVSTLPNDITGELNKALRLAGDAASRANIDAAAASDRAAEAALDQINANKAVGEATVAKATASKATASPTEIQTAITKTVIADKAEAKAEKSNNVAQDAASTAEKSKVKASAARVEVEVKTVTPGKLLQTDGMQPPSDDLIKSMQTFQTNFLLSPTSNITINDVCPAGTSIPRDSYYLVKCTKDKYDVAIPSKKTPAAIEYYTKHSISKQDACINLRNCAVHIMEPLYTIVDKKDVAVTSSFRTLETSENGVPSSIHNRAGAIDIALLGSKLNDRHAHFLLAKQLSTVITKYDKILLEYRDKKNGSRIVWIHIEYSNSSKPAKLKSTMLNDHSFKGIDGKNVRDFVELGERVKDASGTIIA